MIKIYNYGQVSDQEIFARDNIASDVEGVVAQIIADVIKNGDAALREYAAKFDKVQLTSLEVSQQEIDEAFQTVETEFLDILREAAANGVRVMAVSCEVSEQGIKITAPVEVRRSIKVASAS